jgi:hypothetical protein
VAAADECVICGSTDMDPELKNVCRECAAVEKEMVSWYQKRGEK